MITGVSWTPTGNSEDKAPALLPALIGVGTHTKTPIELARVSSSSSERTFRTFSPHGMGFNAGIGPLGFFTLLT